MIKVALKYCGSCNPRIELGPIGRRVRECGDDALRFVPFGSRDTDLVVILNGCPKACADRADVRRLAREVLVVAGEAVGQQTVPEERIADRVIAMLAATARHRREH